MSCGQALQEELVWHNGVLANTNFLDYKIPTVWEVPEVESILVEVPDPEGPFGAKGVAEIAANFTAPAIANAVYDAIGVRINSLPITPEKILQALRERSMEG